MSVLIFSPKSCRRINSIWLAVRHDNGAEGLCTVTAQDVTLPLIAADEQRLVWLKDMVGKLQQIQRDPVQLIRMTSRVDLETVLPAPRFGAPHTRR